ncbi:hypothetical protein ISF6_2089 [Piscinibacter sakaiensis]|uniref:Uncharacterized protein n=1 Tax=Piscinibacter sakaiensis TaxID=1547922 RepID=A0A0K8P136_PISS1|nr:hypothetical protein ISF6_2089 [Piscinibacter sakaiensis]
MPRRAARRRAFLPPPGDRGPGHAVTAAATPARRTATAPAARVTLRARAARRAQQRTGGLPRPRRLACRPAHPP